MRWVMSMVWIMILLGAVNGAFERALQKKAFGYLGMLVVMLISYTVLLYTWGWG